MTKGTNLGARPETPIGMLGRRRCLKEGPGRTLDYAMPPCRALCLQTNRGVDA
jgi:hypothetical protein